MSIMNFCGIEQPSYGKARVVILPAGYSGTVSYGKGTEKGPEAIIRASAHMELWDVEMSRDISMQGILTLPQPKLDKNPERTHQILYSEIKKHVAKNKFVVLLGGEHSVSSAMAKALKEKYSKLSVLQMDAHTDLRYKYGEPPAKPSKYSHACVMRRIREMGIPTVAVGIRSQCDEEAIYVKKEKAPVYYAKDIHDNDAWMDKAIAQLTDDVFLTFDIDAFDPSIMPATGTPEPGGLQWYQTLRFLKKAAGNKRIVGFDIVELAPQKGMHHAEFLAALLVYKLIGYCNRT